MATLYDRVVKGMEVALETAHKSVEVIMGKAITRQQIIDKPKPLLRTFAHSNRDCAVQFDNRGLMNL